MKVKRRERDQAMERSGQKSKLGRRAEVEGFQCSKLWRRRRTGPDVCLKSNYTRPNDITKQRARRRLVRCDGGGPGSPATSVVW